MLLNLCNLYLLRPSCPDPLAFLYLIFFFLMQKGYNNYSQLFDWCGSVEITEIERVSQSRDRFSWNRVQLELK